MWKIWRKAARGGGLGRRPKRCEPKRASEGEKGGTFRAAASALAATRVEVSKARSSSVGLFHSFRRCAFGRMERAAVSGKASEKKKRSSLSSPLPLSSPSSCSLPSHLFSSDPGPPPHLSREGRPPRTRLPRPRSPLRKRRESAGRGRGRKERKVKTKTKREEEQQRDKAAATAAGAARSSFLSRSLLLLSLSLHPPALQSSRPP